MPTWVHDALSDRWVVRASSRADRPRTHGQPAAGCPFCPGNEHATPPEIVRHGGSDAGWLVRVFPNLYPAVAQGSPSTNPDLSDGRPVIGAHEVIAITPEHDASFADLDDAHASLVLRTMLDRVRAHEAAGAAFSQAYINHGAAAGASVDHPHGQIVSVDVVPPVAVTETAATRPGACAVCADMADPDLRAFVDAGVTVVAPRGSWLRDELLVAPTEHGDADVGEFAVALRDALRRLRDAEGDPPYNVVLHPVSGPDGHTHAHVVPRVTTLAGFELGTGLYLSSADPKATAVRIAQASSSNVSDAELMQ